MVELTQVLLRFVFGTNTAFPLASLLTAGNSLHLMAISSVNPMIVFQKGIFCRMLKVQPIHNKKVPVPRLTEVFVTVVVGIVM